MSARVLLWGLLEDPTMAAVHRALRDRGAELVFVNHAAIDRTRVRVAGSAEPVHVLELDGVCCALGDLAAAYLRPFDHRHYGELDVRHAARVHDLLADWAEHTGARVIHRPSLEGANHCKLGRAETMAAVGLPVPESVVTNQPDVIRAFLARYGRAVFKSLSSVRSVVRELRLDELPASAMGPVFVQRLIVGTEFRVHVVGEATFACQVDSEAIDYRYGRARLQPAELPAAVAARCVALTRRLGLWVAGLDLIAGVDGGWYCLEVNPNPGFSAYDEGEIAATVADLLVAERPGLDAVAPMLAK